MSMRPNAVFILAACVVLPLQFVPLQAASFVEATVTRLENDVRVLKQDAAPRTAAVGDQIHAVTSVSTGAGSRAELQFPDKSLTRLGANSRLTIRGEARTLDLDQGVIFLQVPKQMGGAKVRTGAITAAVTGTTTIIENLGQNQGGNLQPDQAGMKYIVIEGELQVFLTEKPSEYRIIHAGEILFMKKDSRFIPAPMQVDVKQMLKTGNKFFQSIEGTPNATQVNDTVQQQQALIASGVLQKSNLVIPGRGSLAVVVDHSSNVAKNAILVHAISNNGQGKGNQGLLNLLAPGGNGAAGLNGNGNGNGKGKGLVNGNGQGLDQGKGNGNNGNNGQGDQGQGQGQGQGQDQGPSKSKGLHGGPKKP
jgi:hypothetical protein